VHGVDSGLVLHGRRQLGRALPTSGQQQRCGPANADQQRGSGADRIQPITSLSPGEIDQQHHRRSGTEPQHDQTAKRDGPRGQRPHPSA
jgi:hypothetical protein